MRPEEITAENVLNLERQRNALRTSHESLLLVAKLAKSLPCYCHELAPEEHPCLRCAATTAIAEAKELTT